jgi:predicted kinase
MRNLKELISKLETTKGNLLVMVGPPLSGKSTIISKLPNSIVISRDAIVEEFGKGLSYTEAFKSVNQKEVTKELNKRLKESSESNNNVIIDMTNLSPKRRKGYIKTFKNHTKIAVTFSLPLETLMERNKIRNEETGKYIPEGVITSMYNSYEYPTKEEGFDYIIKV